MASAVVGALLVIAGGIAALVVRATRRAGPVAVALVVDRDGKVRQVPVDDETLGRMLPPGDRR